MNGLAGCRFDPWDGAYNEGKEGDGGEVRRCGIRCGAGCGKRCGGPSNKARGKGMMIQYGRATSQ